MCQRPCWGMPEDIQKLIDAGYSNRLMLDYWVGDHYEHGGNIEILCPALKGFENGHAPWMPRDERGCTFWNHLELCDLHDKDLKPFEGKMAMHDKESSQYHQQVAMAWNNPEAQQIVQKWKDRNG